MLPPQGEPAKQPSEPKQNLVGRALQTAKAGWSHGPFRIAAKRFLKKRQ
jgi:hypothetical protein